MSLEKGEKGREVETANQKKHVIETEKKDWGSGQVKISLTKTGRGVRYKKTFG